MSKNQKEKKYNYIKKINIINNHPNKSSHLVTKINNISKLLNTKKIFNNNISKKFDDKNENLNQKIHKKIILNIEGYNNLADIKKLAFKNYFGSPIHRRMLTERKISNFNNIKKKNRFVLINTRNKKNKDEYRFITEYFSQENNQNIKNNNSQIISHKNIFNINLSYKKRYMKYLKANNLYNHSLDNTNTKIRTRNNISQINSFDLNESNNIFSQKNSNINLTSYYNSIDIKKKNKFFNYNIKEKRKILGKKFFDDFLKTYNNILTEKPSQIKSPDIKLKKNFIKKDNNNNLTIDKILQEKDKNISYVLKNKIMKLQKKNRNNKYHLSATTTNSINKINNKNLWLKLNIGKDSKIKIAKIMKQKNGFINIKNNNNLIKKIRNIIALTKKGFWQPGIEKPNQDNYFIFKNLNNDKNILYMGICDGHGIYGKEVSSFISQNLPKKLNENIIKSKININKENISLISKIIKNVFIDINKSLILNKNIDTSKSGSTCCSIILSQKKIISINLGDSRCILGKYIPIKNIWSFINISRDHKPQEKDEKERIIKEGGKISKEKDDFGNFKGITRIWFKDGGNIGLALTRSFGDEIMSKVGIICEPEIKEFFLEKNDKFIIIGSDGLWEYISNQECVNFVKEFYLKNDIKGAINFLYKEASKRWILQQDIIDDISIILIFLD